MRVKRLIFVRNFAKCQVKLSLAIKDIVSIDANQHETDKYMLKLMWGASVEEFPIDIRHESNLKNVEYYRSLCG